MAPSRNEGEPAVSPEAARRAHEILADELMAVYDRYPERVDLSAAVRTEILGDVAGFLHAGRMVAIAWGFAAARPAQGLFARPLLAVTRYRLCGGPAPRPTAGDWAPEPKWSSGARFGIWLLPADGFTDLMADTRRAWLAGCFRPWQSLEISPLAVVRPLACWRVWPLAPGQFLIKEGYDVCVE